MKVCTVLLAILFVLTSEAKLTEQALLNDLAKAEDYLHVKPSISSAILSENLEHIALLNKQAQLRWLQNLLRVSVTLNNLSQIESAASLMLVYPELKDSNDKIITLLSSIGIMMRRLGDMEKSIAVFDCALQQSIVSYKQYLSLITSKGISLRHLGKTNEAEQLYQSALVLAKQHNNDTYQSTLYNALGLTALERGNYGLAKQNFVQGMQISQRIARRSGQIITGLNLLLLAIVEHDELLYLRLHSPISSLTKASKNSDRHIYLLLLENAFQVTQGMELPVGQEKLLAEKLDQIKDISLHNLLLKHLAKPLQIDAQPKEIVQIQYSGELLAYTSFCQP